MAVTLYCDPDVLDPSGEGDQVLRAGQILGGESPLEFTDGHALVQDEEAAAALVRKRAEVHLAQGHPDADPDFFAEAEDSSSGDSGGDGSEGDTSAADEEPEAEHGDQVQAVLDGTWQEAVSTVEAGDADDFLDELEAAEGRDSVLAAIEARRG